MKARCLLIPLVLGVGLALTLLWAVGSGNSSVVAALHAGHIEAPTTELHVCPGGCAYSSVQDAVDAANDGAVIKVAADTYTDLHTRLVYFQTITQVVYIDKSITIQGGYTTSNWDEADPVVNLTVLDAQGQGRVLYIASEATNLTIEGLYITGGNAAGLGGGTLGEDVGGGVYVSADAVTIRNNQVISNTADDYGGGLYLPRGVATLSGNTIAYNSANCGGGLFLSCSAATLSSNVVTSNTANLRGGGLLLLHSGDAVLNGSTIIANTADEGGGLYLDKESDATLTNNIVAGNQASTAGSGLYIQASSPRLLHTTIASNSGGDGSGFYVTNEGAVYSSVALTNTILANHTLGINVTVGNVVTLNGVLWYNNTPNYGGTGSISVTNEYTGTPAFVDPDAWDYHISLTSQARDKGVPAGVDDDIDGEPRPQGNGYDIGADETGLAVTKQACPNPVNPGAQLNYTIRVTNTSDVTLTVTITDILPNHVTPTGIHTWPPFVIPPGDVGTRTVVVTVEVDYTGVLTNVVQVTTDKGVDGFHTATSLVGYGAYLPLVMRNG